MRKILLASGCSFTFEKWNWPTFVAEELDMDLLNVGMGSQGNGLISKKTIYSVTELLKTYKSEDILVGIMWSGVDRYEFHIDFNNHTDREIYKQNIDGWFENPTDVVPGHKNWIIANPHWNSSYSLNWYENYHTNIGSMVNTLQYILLTQFFLEKNNIKYFMTTYMDIFYKQNISHNNYITNNVETKYLYDMINFDKFVPIIGCHEWVKEHYEYNGGFNPPDNKGIIGVHPTEFGHKRFSNEVLVPFIKDNIL